MLTTRSSAFLRPLELYFRERLTELSQALDPPLQDDTLWYVGTVLARFGTSDQLFHYDRGEVTIRPLALLYKDAHEAQTQWQRCLLLRQLGDLALFLGALFPEHYEKRGISQDYFVGMGGGAYDYLADNTNNKRHLFSELAQTFTKLLDLVAQACFKQTQFDACDVLRLYQRWRANQDPRLAQQLQTLGIHIENDPGVLH